MNKEKLQDGYEIMSMEMFEYANKAPKEELSWWEEQVIKGLEITLQVYKLYAEQNGIKLLEPEDYLEEKEKENANKK